MQAKTDEKGEVVFALPVEKLGGPGRVELSVATEATGLLNPAMRSFEVMLYTLPKVTLKSDVNEASAGESALLSGRVTERGQGVSRAKVHIRDRRRTVAVGTTDEAGRFRTRLELRNLPTGENRLVARLVPKRPWRRAARSNPVKLLVHPLEPLPVGFYVVPVVLTALLVAGLVALRRKPWRRWLKAMRQRQEEKAQKAGVKLGRTRLSSLLGGGMTTVRGRVVDRNGDSALEGVEILVFPRASGEAGRGDAVAEAKSGADGGFGPFSPQPGSYELRLAKEGFLSQEMDVTVPTGGALMVFWCGWRRCGIG